MSILGCFDQAIEILPFSFKYQVKIYSPLLFDVRQCGAFNWNDWDKMRESVHSNVFSIFSADNKIIFCFQCFHSLRWFEYSWKMDTSDISMVEDENVKPKRAHPSDSESDSSPAKQPVKRRKIGAKPVSHF